MRYLFATLSVIAIAATSSAQGGGARLATCLHGQNETSEHAARREKAIRVAHAINAAQVVVVGPQKQRYRRPEQLMNIPPLPQGFELQFNTDGASYNFAIKDTLDLCHFAIFSDQDKFVYTATPLTNARIVPLTTK
jgi:hypothetical protein